MVDLSTEYLDNKRIDQLSIVDDWYNKRLQKAKEESLSKPPEPISIPTVEPPKESHLGNLLKGAWEQTKEVGKAIATTPEVALSTLTGMAAWPIAKAGGLMTMPFWGGEEAQKLKDYL